MPAKRAAQLRQEPILEALRVLAAEPLVQRQRNQRHGRPQINRLVRCPASLARIGDIGRDFAELLIVLQEARNQVQQPAAEDRAIAPRFGDGGEVYCELL